MAKKMLVVTLVLSLGLMVSACTNHYSIETEVSEGGVIEISPTQDEYEEGEEITIEAVADASYEFVEWSGDLEGEDNPVELKVDEDMNIEAQFKTDMVLVEAGTTSEDNGEVTVEEDFYIDKHHVTQAEFEEVMGFNPSGFNDEDHPDLEGDTADRPVEHVTWYDAVKYANKLSKAEGLDKYYNISDIEYKGDEAEDLQHPQNIDDAEVTENEGANGYRLPTEDEHEYAARGGENGEATTYAGSDNLNEVGWSYYKSDVANSEYDKWDAGNRGTMPIGQKEANELGLYDMSGNLFDWTNTRYDSNRMRRGGSWINGAISCMVSSSFSYTPSNSRYNLGFRLARRP